MPAYQNPSPATTLCPSVKRSLKLATVPMPSLPGVSGGFSVCANSPCTMNTSAGQHSVG